MKKLFFILAITFLLASCTDEELLRFTVNAGDLSYLDCPVSVEISAIAPKNYNFLELYEETEKGAVKIPFQIDKSGQFPLLWFKLEGEFHAGRTKIYYLKRNSSHENQSDYKMKILETDDELIIFDEGRSVLAYRTSVKKPPEGVDSIYKRSAYIHPLWSPGGEILTRIQAPDHYHHYGIWNPWTLTHINGREIDYWNLAKGEGTVRFGGKYYTVDGDLFSQFEVKQEHIDFGSGVPERVSMEEDLRCTYWGLDKAGKRYILDKSMSFRNILRDTIIFDAYRYGGGIGFRATEKWKADNCSVLTSEGKTRLEADGTKARWCIVEGESSTEEGRSGILFISHPDNREHPEPMRVWPMDVNNGEIFFEFCPIRHNDWVILPGVENILQYRMVVFDGSMTAGEAEMYWNGFAHAPEVLVK